MKEPDTEAAMVNKTVRFPRDEYQMLQARAADEGVSFSAYVRMVVMLHAGGFDRKEQTFLDRLDRVLDAQSRIERLAAIAIASAAIPKNGLPSSLGDAAESQALELVLAHIKYSGGLSDSIAEAVRNKKL